MKKILFYIIYWLLSLTWGIIMTAIGAMIALIMILTGHKPKRLGPNVYLIGEELVSDHSFSVVKKILKIQNIMNVDIVYKILYGDL